MKSNNDEWISAISMAVDLMYEQFMQDAQDTSANEATDGQILDGHTHYYQKGAD